MAQSPHLWAKAKRCARWWWWRTWAFPLQQATLVGSETFKKQIRALQGLQAIWLRACTPSKVLNEEDWQAVQSPWRDQYVNNVLPPGKVHVTACECANAYILCCQDILGPGFWVFSKAYHWCLDQCLARSKQVEYRFDDWVDVSLVDWGSGQASYQNTYLMIGSMLVGLPSRL